MTAPAPSELAFIRFVSVENMMKLIHRTGIEEMMAGLVDYIEEDFRRWELFDKTPRVASHSEEGEIQQMPEDFAVTEMAGAQRQGARPDIGTPDHPLRRGRLRDRGFLRPALRP